MKQQNNVILLTVLLILLSLTNPSESAESKVYHNDRYGFSVTLPTILTKEHFSDNNDGGTFFSPDGQVKLSVYGSCDIGTLYTGTKYAEEFIADVRKNTNGKIVNFKRDKNWFIMEYHYKGYISYRKTFYSKDMTNTFIFSFPKNKENKNRGYIKSIEQSFTPGPLH